MRNVAEPDETVIGGSVFSAIWAVPLMLLALQTVSGAEPSDAGRVATRPNPGAAAGEHPLARAIELAKASQKALESVRDYEAIFYKREQVGRRLIAHQMRIKHRVKPFSVYLRFRKPHTGREVIYVDGKNDGNLLVHETGLVGFLGTFSLKPTSPDALSESLHPITNIGMPNLVGSIIAQWEAERRYGETDVKYYQNAKLGTTDCFVIQSTHPQRRKHFNFHKTMLYLDKEHNFPVRVEQWEFPHAPGAAPRLSGSYTYMNIKANVDFNDRDFDTRNPKYGF
jgi:hypothetical protein